MVPPSSMAFAMSSDSTLPSCFCLPILVLDGLPGCNSLMLLENLFPEKAFQFSAPLRVGVFCSRSLCKCSIICSLLFFKDTISSISKIVLLLTGGQTAQPFSVHLQSISYLVSTWKAASIALLSQRGDFYELPQIGLQQVLKA